MTELTRQPGEQLPVPCGNAYHGARLGPALAVRVVYPLDQHDPNCQTCAVRAMLSEHDHLHLASPDRDACQTPGIGGVPGQTVKCKCGAYHH